MNYLFRALYFVLLVLALALPTWHGLYGLGLMSAIGALIAAASINHPTERQEGAYLVAPVTAFFWVGVVYFSSRELVPTLLSLLFFGAGMMALAMMGGSFLWNGPDDPMVSEEALITKLGRAVVEDFRRSRSERAERKLSMRGVLHVACWLCVFASAAVVLTKQPVLFALTLSVAAIALTFSYDAASVGRMRSTYAAFASLCFIGAFGPWDLGLIPLIFFIMMGLMALLTTNTEG